MAREIKVEGREAIEVTWPNGITLRMRWDPAEGGVKLTAETTDSGLATDLLVRPRSNNGVILEVR